ncbi:bifunctional folylpolyglutamate synthase/dihydrofolate synthase [Halobacillus sp. H74]|uniref:bifunctional folylpolyglutamate synthase/dihydrofolate synthase n=1 Tax=Halobacillus sp. H74 TaxID=3457436 RepID=UPI003FCEB2A6
MNYQDAIDWIHSREKFKVKPGLKRMSWMMEKLGHPEAKLRVIHIAGTNGKGSTVSFLRHLLQAQGYSVGTFTSPYIEKFNERISMNGLAISDESLALLVERMKPLAEELQRTPFGEPTEFEIITAMAMVYFSHQHLNYVLIETGLGGRYDSTNIVTPILSAITNIGLDHMNILGSTIEQIAEEKAGIIKKGVPVVTGVKQAEAWKVIHQQAEKCHADLHTLGKEFYVEHSGSIPDGEVFSFKNKEYATDELLSSMKGRHQVENAALALQTMEIMKSQGVLIDRSLYGVGVKQTTWPARFEKVMNTPLTIIDGAHNEEGTRALVETVKSHYDGKKIALVYAALEDKPVKKMLKQLSDIADVVYATTFDFPRSLSAPDLAELSPIEETFAVSQYSEAIELAAEEVGQNGVLLITGSLYFISNVRKYFESRATL